MTKRERVILDPKGEVIRRIDPDRRPIGFRPPHEVNRPTAQRPSVLLLQGASR